MVQREYGIPRDELLWGYTWGEILEYLGQIPVTRVVHIHSGMEEEDINTAYLMTVCDRDVESTSEESYLAFMERLNKVKE